MRALVPLFLPLSLLVLVTHCSSSGSEVSDRDASGDSGQDGDAADGARRDAGTGGPGHGDAADASDASEPDDPCTLQPKDRVLGGGPPDGDGSPGCVVTDVTCSDRGARYTCADGHVEDRGCPSGCDPAFGCRACEPGSRRCDGSNAVVCTDDGRSATVTACGAFAGDTCIDGTCVGAPCKDAVGTAAGCELVAVTTPHPVAVSASRPFALSVRSTTTEAATVVVTGGALEPTQEVRLTLPPQGAAWVELPWVTALAEGTSGRLPGAAYRVRSTRPVIVHQMSPRPQASQAVGGEGTLLLPNHALGTGHTGLGLPAWRDGSGAERPTYLSLVAVDDDTVVVLKPSAAAEGLGACNKVRLARGDVWQVASATSAGAANELGGDLSGTAIASTKPLLVVASNGCVAVPATAATCSHVEETVLPHRLLGTEHAIVPPTGRAARLRVVATTAPTALSFEPPIAGAPASLAPGKVFEAPLTIPVRLRASEPVAVVLVEDATATTGPSMTSIPATTGFSTLHDGSTVAGAEGAEVTVVTAAGATATLEHDGATTTLTPAGRVPSSDAGAPDAGGADAGPDASGAFAIGTFAVCGGGAGVCQGRYGITSATRLATTLRFTAGPAVYSTLGGLAAP